MFERRDEAEIFLKTEKSSALLSVHGQIRIKPNGVTDRFANEKKKETKRLCTVKIRKTFRYCLVNKCMSCIKI